MIRRMNRRMLCLLALAGSGVASAEVDFRAASAGLVGKEQREYIERLLDAKPKATDQPVKSLMALQAVATAVGARPLVDISAMSRDKMLSGEIWHRYAEKLYIEERYVQAEEAVRRISDAYLEANLERVGALQIKLALRGIGELPPKQNEAGGDPVRELNFILAAVGRGELEAAIGRLRAIATDPKRPIDLRHRALVMTAALLHQAEAKPEALATLAAVDGASIYQIDTLMAYLRLNEAIHPGQIAAVERLVAARSENSPLVWEVRERLVRSLRASGAGGQAAESVLDSISSIDRALKLLQQETGRVERMGLTELLQRSDSLPESRKSRVASLLQYRQSLEKTAQLLRRWQPYILSYLERLQRDRTRFEDEIREAQFSTSGELEKDSSRLTSLFHLEMSKLIGKPVVDDTVFRLFFGLVNWEFSYEYPATWRPSAAAQEKQTDRRRRRGAALQRENDDQVFLPMAMAHVEKLAWKIAEKLSQFPRHTSLQTAETLVARSAEKAVEIERTLAMIDEAIRFEIIQDVKDRKSVAEQWLNHYAAQAMSDNAKIVSGKELPYFTLTSQVTPRRGESLVRALDAIPSETGQKVTAETAIAPVYEALRPVALSGETKKIRADALLMRAQMGVMLYEAQIIPSPADAIDHYAALLRDFPELIDVADVTYQLARAQDLGQQLEKSLATLEGFAKKFPKDSRAFEAYFRIAEHQFSLSEYPRAKPAYELVIRQGDKRYLDQAEYKLAWTMFKLGDFRGALPKFIAVIDRGYGQAAGDDLTRRNRMQDALRATALTFSNLEGPLEVERYFVGTAARPYVSDIYQTLARYYLDHRRVNDGSVTYTLLHKYYPDNSQAAVLLADLVVGARRESLAKIALELQELFVNRYSISSSYWEKAAPEVRNQILGHMKPFASQLGQMYHADAQQQKKPESYQKAIKYYSQYVDTFPNDKETPGIHFLLADARFETGDFDKAIVDYEKLAYGYGPHEKAAESGYALLVTTQKIIELENDVAEKKKKLATLVARSGRFSTVFPGDLRVDDVLAKAGEDTLSVGEPAEAVRLSEALLARNPSETARRRASQTLAHGLFETSAFVRAEAAYVKALAFKGYTPKEVNDMTERLGLSVYRQAEGLVAAGDTKQAIETFLKVGKVAPGTEAVANSIIEATVLLASTKRWSEAIELLEGFGRNFAGHKLNADVPVRLAVAYENDGKFLKAADTLESISQTEKDEPLARQMVTRAAELREKGGRTDLAIATYERYLDRYPEPIERASEVRQTLSDIAAKGKDITTRDRWLNDLIAKAKSPTGRESVRVRFLAAKASIVLGDDVAKVFEATKLTLPFEKSLAAKRGSMESALRWFEEASRFGVLEVTTAATYKTAEIYRQMAKDMMASERPKGLSELEMSQYNILLEEQSAPIEEKATELHEINYGRIKTGTYDEWIKKSLVALRALFAGTYDKVEVEPGFFNYVPPKPAAAPDVRPAAAPAPKDAGVSAGQNTQPPPGPVEGVAPKTPVSAESKADASSATPTAAMPVAVPDTPLKGAQDATPTPAR